MNPGFHPALLQQLRELTPRVLGAVARRCADFAAAEDAVQDALLAAVSAWPERGVPQNPGGWLFHVACRRLQDHLDAERSRARREASAVVDRDLLAMPADDDAFAAIGDETLALLLLCCHPTLSTPSAIALTLRAVGGLTTAEIARAFLVSEATMAQRISRAKQSIQQCGVPFALPDAATRGERFDAARNVLYLMFNEGHTSTGGPDLVRDDLAEEAIRLTRLLDALAPDDAESQGLLALLLLSHSRRHTRIGAQGELIPLDEQDRSRWDRAAIAEGRTLVERAMARGPIGRYAVQAAIAALHAEAASVVSTDWKQIAALYSVLQRMTDSPVVALNRAVAIAMVQGPAAGLAIVDSLAADPRITEGHRLDAVRAHLHERAGDPAAAALHFRAAAQKTANAAEQQYLLRKAVACAARRRDVP